MWKKEAVSVSFTKFFTPAVLLLLLLAVFLLVRGIRTRSKRLIVCSAGVLVLIGLCVSLVMEFITRM